MGLEAERDSSHMQAQCLGSWVEGLLEVLKPAWETLPQSLELGDLGTKCFCVVFVSVWTS